MINTKKTRQITVSEMSPHIHSFDTNENKVTKLSVWLIDWIKKSLKAGTIQVHDFLPSKSDLAFHIGVSKGTMQNVFRYVEDCGYIESKPKVGTYIIEFQTSNKKNNKLTSKRELAAEEIKKYIIRNGYKVGDTINSTRELSKDIGYSATTIRMAIVLLVTQNILEKDGNHFKIKNNKLKIQKIESATLVDKIADQITEFIRTEYKIGEKIPSNIELSKKFHTSVKTVHDAIKLLNKSGILQIQRGQYGTTYVNNNPEEKIYCYEHVEQQIRHYIASNCKIGSKLPSITDFSKLYKLSGKTIKKALDNLRDEGYVTFTRGRYGGTYVTDIPQGVNTAYTWLALSPEYVPNIETT